MTLVLHAKSIQWGDPPECVSSVLETITSIADVPLQRRVASAFLYSILPAACWHLVDQNGAPITNHGRADFLPPSPELILRNLPVDKFKLARSRVFLAGTDAANAYASAVGLGTLTNHNFKASLFRKTERMGRSRSLLDRRTGLYTYSEINKYIHKHFGTEEFVIPCPLALRSCLPKDHKPLIVDSA